MDDPDDLKPRVIGGEDHQMRAVAMNADTYRSLIERLGLRK